MSPPAETLQRIRRLAPLGEIIERLDAVARPVAPRALDTAAATGAVLAQDVSAGTALPAAAVALRDGWAVAAEQVADAGAYAPAPLHPAPAWVETGQQLPPGTDVVLPADAVTFGKAGAEAHASAAPGEGVALPGTDAGEGAILRRAGQALRPTDIAVLAAAGVMTVTARMPRIKIFSVNVPTRSRGDTISPLIARAVEAEGGQAQVAQAATLESALLDRAADAVVAIGGTGTGKRDAAVKTLERVGKVELHGLGISPGETAALGSVGGRPVLMLPGRLDAALAAFLIVGRLLLARLSGTAVVNPGAKLTLNRKVTSTVGLAEMVLCRRAGDGIEPLASAVFPLQALAQADGWIVIPPGSEGFAAGAIAEMWPLP